MPTSSTPQPSFRERVAKAYADGRAYYKRSPRLQRITWQGKVGPAFWQTASVLSLIINLILIIVMLVVVRYVFTLKSLIRDGLIGGLYDNFVLMGSGQHYGHDQRRYHLSGCKTRCRWSSTCRSTRIPWWCWWMTPINGRPST
jgi:hypothetical protein